jgi:hypothetical protein
MCTKDNRRIQKAIIDLVSASGDTGIPPTNLADTLVAQGVGVDMAIREALLAMYVTSADMSILLTPDRRLRALRPNERAPTPHDAHLIRR